MFTGQVAVISNKATWQTPQSFELEDEDGTVTDLTTVSPLAIAVTIKDINGCLLATASIDNGKVTVPGPGFQWRFEVSDLSNLCAGTYRLGVKVTISGLVVDVIDGTIAVLEGN